MEFRETVHPECPNAGNAFHECTYKCFDRISSGEVKKEKSFFGFRKKTPIRSTPPASPVRNTPFRSPPPASPVRNTPIRSTPPASPVRNTPFRSTPPANPVKNTPIRSTPASPARLSGDKSPFSSYYYSKKNEESVDSPSYSSDENTGNFQRHHSPARIQLFQPSPLSGNNTPDRHRAETSGDRTPRSRVAERRSPTPYYYSEKYEESDDFPAFASSDETSGYVWKQPSPAHGRPVQTKPAVENKSLPLSPSVAVYFDQGEITQTPDRQTPKDLGKEKEPRSRPMTPEHRSRTPEHRSRTPEHRSRPPERRSRTPEPTSRILDPRSRTPEPQSTAPEPYSRISKPRSRTPEPQHTTLEFQTESPRLRTRSPGPRSRTPEPHPGTLAFQPSSPEPRFRNPESRPRTPEHRPTTPNSPRPKTPSSPRSYFTSETMAESVYSDDGESVLLFPELLLSPDRRPVSRPTTPDRRRVDTANKLEEPHRVARSEIRDEYSYGEERSVYLYPETALSSDTKLRSASSTPVHYKFRASTEQEDYVKHYDPPELPDESESFSLSEIAKMRGMKTFDKEEFQSIISESCVSVGIYKVRASVSSTLQSILDKYGDIASGSKLQSLTTRSYYLESLSSVVLELKSTRLKKLTETRVQEVLALVRDMESVKIEVGWFRLILTDLLEAVKHLNRHETSVIEKETCDRDWERGKKEMEEKMKELSLKEKEIKECRGKVTEIGGRLGHLEMQRSRLTNRLTFLRSKVEKFQGKSVLDQLL